MATIEALSAATGPGRTQPRICGAETQPVSAPAPRSSLPGPAGSDAAHVIAAIPIVLPRGLRLPDLVCPGSLACAAAQPGPASTALLGVPPRRTGLLSAGPVLADRGRSTHVRHLGRAGPLLCRLFPADPVAAALAGAENPAAAGADFARGLDWPGDDPGHLWHRLFLVSAGPRAAQLPGADPGFRPDRGLRGQLPRRRGQRSAVRGPLATRLVPEPPWIRRRCRGRVGWVCWSRRWGC